MNMHFCRHCYLPLSSHHHMLSQIPKSHSLLDSCFPFSPLHTVDLLHPLIHSQSPIPPSGFHLFLIKNPQIKLHEPIIIMSMYGRDPWGGPLEINTTATDSATDDDRSRNMNDFDKTAARFSRTLDETQQSWLLGPGEQKKKRYVDLGCIIVSRKIFIWTVGTILAAAFVAGIVTVIVKNVPRHHKHVPPPDNYTLALRKALLFFNAQKSGKLPRHNNVSWRGNSCLNDGKSDKSGAVLKDLVGGYYDAGDAINFHLPKAFAMTMLSWSVIEYSAKYEAAGELAHVREIIRWGTDYFP